MRRHALCSALASSLEEKEASMLQSKLSEF